MSQHKTHQATSAVRAGIDCDPQFGAVVPPIHLSSTYTFQAFGAKRRYDYSRSANPTRDMLGEALAEMERGHGTVVTASGMAAIICVVQLLKAGDLLLAPHDCYGGSWRLFDALARRGSFQLEFVDFTNPEATRQALKRRPKLVWLETPSNPLLRITDIRSVSHQARLGGALVVVDNTFLSPALQRPLELGADIVVHSTTKYLNGHSDVVGGAVVCKEKTLFEELAWWANCLGLTGAPFDSYLTLRGVRTLNARLRVHEENAGALAQTLLADPAVARVYYPGLASHPGHKLAARQQDGFGAMISVELRGGEAAVREFLDGLRYFSLAESLGGVESLIAHPATMTHASMSEEARGIAGIGNGLLRLSVGIEDASDLCADIKRGLDRALAAVPKELFA